MKIINYLSISVFATSIFISANAAELDPLFQSNDVLAITITAPFGQIDRDRDKEAEYKDATLAYVDKNGDQHEFVVELEVRGNNRLKKDVCRYSQLWVNFKKGQVEGTLFENQDKIKLVVQCRGQSRYADYIIKEQQAYRLFNQLSNYSFQSRLIQATYVDSERDNSIRTHIAFFIEHQDRLAKRAGMENFEESDISIGELDPQQSSLVSLFMYLISNTDYSIIRGTPDDECCHNAKLLESESLHYFPIPYDFDSTGYVNTSYAVPAEGLRQRNVRQRIFRGFCVPDVVMENSLTKFREAREAISEIVSDTTHVSSRVANRSLNYVDEFYQIIDDPRKLESEITEECRG